MLSDLMKFLPVRRRPARRLRVECFRGTKGLVALASAWRKLAANLLVKRHFHCVEWHLALAETMERFGEQDFAFFALFDGGDLVGVVPLRRVALDLLGLRLEALQLLSNIEENPTARDIVLASSAPDLDVFPTLIAHLEKFEPSWDVLSLRGLLDDSFALRALVRVQDAPTLALPGGAHGRVDTILCGPSCRPFDRLSKSFRQLAY